MRVGRSMISGHSAPGRRIPPEQLCRSLNTSSLAHLANQNGIMRWRLAHTNNSPEDSNLSESASGSSHELERLREMFEQAPGAMAILRGSEHRFEMVNPAYLQLIGHREVVGKKLAEALPEIAGQGFIELLDQVHRNGKAHVGKSVTVSLQRSPGAPLEERVLDFVYQPLKDASGVVNGIFVEATDVTERSRAETALAQQGRLYRAILDNTPDLAYIFDLKHRFAYANAGLLKMWGKTWDEAIGKTCLELGYEPWHAAMHDREIEQVIASKQPVRGEVPFTGSHGRRTYDYLFVPVFDDNGEVEAVAGTTRDVTERQLSEEALRQSEARFRQLIAVAPVGIAISETDGRVLQANDALLAILGCTRAEAEKHPLDWQRFTPPEDLHRDIAHMEALRRGALPPPFEKEFIRYDGSRASVLIVGRFIPGEGERMVAFAIDITERKRAEASLRETEKRLSRIFETNLLGVLYFNINGGVQDANDEFLRITGYEREDLRNGSIDWSRMTPEEFQTQDARAVVDLRRLGAHAAIEKQYIRKDGLRVWVLVGSAMIDGESGVGFVLDLSGLKAADDALREADRRKDEFLATLAHELRNPLAPIRNAAELLKRSSSHDQHVRRASEIIDRQVHHMVRLVDDLLDVSRITLGQVNLRHEPVSLGAVLTDAIETIRPAIEAAEHSLTVHLPAENMQVQGDATRLSQVFQNILSNAAKYTQRHGSITLRVEREGVEARVRIRDNGMGIPIEMQSRIFDLFTRVHPTNEIKISGLGIGLALAKQLVELHAGRIEVHSKGAGTGSEFVVTLPLVGSLASAVPTPAVPSSMSLASGHRRVLVVDDNRDAAESLGMLLRLSGCHVEVAFDGFAALEIVEAFKPEVVLLDIGMPGLDGYETARRLRKSTRGKDMLIVALTGWGQKEDKQRALDAGFDEHLTKPMDPAVLERLLQLAR
jgi:PAS domain S-box-containing protein